LCNTACLVRSLYLFKLNISYPPQQTLEKHLHVARYLLIVIHIYYTGYLNVPRLINFSNA
jgi:hypothetical protein